MKKFLYVLTILSALSMSGAVMATGDAEAGKQKMLVCSACHGMDGNGIAPNFPNLAGQGAQYIVKQLEDFKSSKRNDPTMIGMVMPLSKQDMEDIAAYYVQQAPKIGVADETKVALGESIYRGGITAPGISACSACHGPGGAGNPAAAYPALRGQTGAYIVKALNDFRSGTRSNDPNSMMRSLAKRMTDQEIEAVSSYIQGLHSQ